MGKCFLALIAVAALFTACVNDKKSCQCSGAVIDATTAVVVEASEDCASASYTTVVNGVTVQVDCE